MSMVGTKIRLDGYGASGPAVATVLSVSKTLVTLQFGADNAGTKFGTMRFRLRDGLKAGNSDAWSWRRIPEETLVKLREEAPIKHTASKEEAS